MSTKRFVSFALLFASMICAGCSKPVAQVPTSYVTFQPTDSSFSCDAPSNWKNTPYTDMGGDSGANFVSGPAKINISTSAVGGLVGDLATAQVSQGQNLADSLGVSAAPQSTSPIEKLHEELVGDVKADYPDYNELKSQSVEGKSGEGEMSEFTADSAKTHGYRATYMAKDRSIEIVCSCPEEDWTKLQTSFEHIIESVAPGTGGN